MLGTTACQGAAKALKLLAAALDSDKLPPYITTLKNRQGE